MKRFALILFVAGIGLAAQAQDADAKITPAAKGVTYGAGTTEDGAVKAVDVYTKLMGGTESYEGKIKGKVTSVCTKKGCWMKLETGEGEGMTIKFQDYAFFMPQDIVGREVVLDGKAIVKTTSVEELKHLAEDAGKSKKEIKAIKEPKKEATYTAKGVLVL
jgi:hypothetical protein